MVRKVSFAVLVAVVLAVGEGLGGDWRHFRGTDNRSVCDQAVVPTSFGPEENVAWKVPLPGPGPASPIVVGGRVIVTCSTGARDDRLHVLAFDAQSGKLLWHRQLWATGVTVHNPFGGVANSTPASDGRRIFALFSSNDLACFDLEGNLLWLRGFTYEHPLLRNDVGMASSPLVIGNTLIVQMESEGEAFVVGLDVENGQTKWRLDRPPGATWCSPTVLKTENPADTIVLLQTRGKLSGHEPATGKELWTYEADCHTIASVTTWGNRIYLPANGIHCLQYDPQTKSVKFLWYERRLRGNNSSPVVYRGRLYRIKSPGILMCADAETGRLLWQLRLGGDVWATPVAVNGHLYVVTYDGIIHVVKLDDRGQLVASCQLDSKLLASPAVADDAIYFRSDSHLWKIAFDRKDAN